MSCGLWDCKVGERLTVLMEVALLVFHRWMDEYAARQSQCPARFGVSYYD
jgi:hypothetical protein